LDGLVYGYNNVDGFREGLRLLTGGSLSDNWLPPQCKSIKPLVKELDQVMYKLVTTTVSIFKITTEKLVEDYKLPLLTNGSNDNQEFRPNNFAMLDIAYYPNLKTSYWNGLKCSSS